MQKTKLPPSNAWATHDTHAFLNAGGIEEADLEQADPKPPPPPPPSETRPKVAVARWWRHEARNPKDFAACWCPSLSLNYSHTF